MNIVIVHANGLVETDVNVSGRDKFILRTGEKCSCGGPLTPDQMFERLDRYAQDAQYPESEVTVVYLEVPAR